MSKTKKPTTVALIGAETSARATTLLNDIARLKEARELITNTPFKCQGLVLRKVKVEECRDLELLIKMAADVVMSIENYERAATQVLGLAKYPVHKIEGYSADAVIADIKLSAALTTQVEQNALIEQMEKIASKYMTPEDERQRDFEILQNLHSQFNSLANNFVSLEN